MRQPSSGQLDILVGPVQVIVRTFGPRSAGGSPTTPTRLSALPEQSKAAITLARKLAGDGLVCVTAGDLGGQEGVRFFASHAGTALLDDPDQVVQGDRGLHLHYTVRG